jgi:hypothetical protein
MGIGQGVAENGLHLRAGQGQGRSGHDCREHARKPEFPENGIGREAETVSAEKVGRGEDKENRYESQAFHNFREGR